VIPTCLGVLKGGLIYLKGKGVGIGGSEATPVLLAKNLL